MLDADLSVIRDTLAAGGGVIATRDDIDAVLTDLLPPTGLAERGVRYQTGKPWTVQMPHDWPKLLRRMPPAIAPGRDLGARRSHRTPNARGNTIKPLTAEAHLAGCWRVRLGDYRLISRPDVGAHRVDVISGGVQQPMTDCALLRRRGARATRSRHALACIDQRGAHIRTDCRRTALVTCMSWLATRHCCHTMVHHCNAP